MPCILRVNLLTNIICQNFYNLSSKVGGVWGLHEKRLSRRKDHLVVI